MTINCQLSKGFTIYINNCSLLFSKNKQDMKTCCSVWKPFVRKVNLFCFGWLLYKSLQNVCKSTKQMRRTWCCIKLAAVCLSWYRLKEFPIYTYGFSAGVLDISTVHSANNALGKFFVKFHISWSEIVLLLLTEYWFCLKAVMHWLKNEHTQSPYIINIIKKRLQELRMTIERQF